MRAVIFDALTSVSGIAKKPEPMVRVASYGDFAVHYEIRYPLAEFSAYLETEAEIMSLLGYRFKRAVDIPMPIRDISVRQVTPESMLADQDRRASEIMGLMGKSGSLLLSSSELKTLVSRLKVMTFAGGEIPVKQGEPGDSFYIIKSGRVNVVVEKTAGETAVVATLGPGNFFGEMSLLTGAVRTASIHAKEDAEFIVIDKESFRSTLANNPSIAESLSHFLSERQAGLEAERERLDEAGLERRKKDVSGRMLSRIKDFFGLVK